jgi:UDP-N-acetylglucosamine 3-dehydrogenase
MSQSSTFRAAILGCGGRGRAHAAGYAAARNVRLVAVADPVAENARALAAEHEATAYADYRALLESERPEVVSVCTWPHLHRKMVQAAIAAGARAIHCQKPMAPTWGDARADATVLSVLGLIECLQSGREPELSSRRARAATELIFATYESSRRRARIDLPLTIDDSPLLTGLEQNLWQPA